MEIIKAFQLKPTLIVKVFALLHLGEIVPGSLQLYDAFGQGSPSSSFYDPKHFVYCNRYFILNIIFDRG